MDFEGSVWFPRKCGGKCMFKDFDCLILERTVIMAELY